MKTYFAIEKHYGLLDQMLVSGGNFLTLALCANYLPLEEQGKFIYIFSSYIGVILLNISGIFQGAAVRAPTQNDSYVSALARLQIFSAFSISILIAIIWLKAGPYFGWTLTFYDLILIALFLFIQQLCDFARRASYIFTDAKNAFLTSLLTYPGRIIALFLLRPEGINTVLLILIASACIPALITIREANKYHEPFLVWKQGALEHLRYSKLFIVGSLLTWLWAYTPVFILGAIQGKATAALLASIRGISSVANIFMEQLETKVVADWSRLYHREGANKLKVEIFQLNMLAFGFWSLVMLIIWFFDKQIVNAILGGKYESSAYVLAIAWISYGAFYIVRVHGIVHRTFGDNRIEFLSGGFGLLAAVLGSYWLISYFKMDGAAWVYCLIAVVMLIAQLLLPKKNEK